MEKLYRRRDTSTPGDVLPVLRPVWILILLFISSNCLFAQTFQLAGLGYARYAKTSIVDSPTEQEVEFQEYSFFAKLPLRFKNPKTVLMTTLRYGLVQPTAHNSPLFVEAQTRKNLHSITMSPTLVQSIGEKWKLIAAVTPTLASDFGEKLSGDDLLFQGFLLASVQCNAEWSLGGGLIYTTQLGEPRFLPAVQLRYVKSRHFFSMLLPSNINYLYQLDQKEKLRLGLRLATNGGNYNVNNQGYTAVIPNSINKILFSRLQMGALVHCQLTKTILLEAFGGISAARKFKLEGEAKQLVRYNSGNGGFFSLGIYFTPPAKAEEGDVAM